jgi:hypothetical protein
MKLIGIAAVLGLAISSSNACDVHGNTGFMPENNLKIGIHDKVRNDMTEERFNYMIDRVSEVYTAVVAGKGKRLVFNRKWTDDTVNASAQQSGSRWIVNMYGGLARHETVTDDAFAMVVCHEMGHHLGGAPKIRSWFSTWASNEGQSDYWGAMKCFRRVFEKDDNVKIVSEMADVSPIVTSNCNETYPNEAEAALCIRAAMAGKSLATLLGSLRNTPPPQFETPDSSVVSRTDNRHPAAQCRLDTYFQGTICDKDVLDDVSNSDPAQGTCTRSEGAEKGLRPLCWYKP